MGMEQDMEVAISFAASVLDFSWEVGLGKGMEGGWERSGYEDQKESVRGCYEGSIMYEFQKLPQALQLFIFT